MFLDLDIYDFTTLGGVGLFWIWGLKRYIDCDLHTITYELGMHPGHGKA